MTVKLHTEYASVMHMPVPKENAREKGPQGMIDSYGHKQYFQNSGMLTVSIIYNYLEASPIEFSKSSFG